jgi:hypothetical protein
MQAGAVIAFVSQGLMTTNTQIQVVPAIFNGTITKLEKRIAASWGQLERAVQSKDITATRVAVNRLSHLEALRQKHVALEQTIVQTITNGSSSQTAPVPEGISISLPGQTAAVLESISNGPSIEPAPAPETRSNSLPIEIQPAPDLGRGSVNLFIQTAPVPGSGSNGLPSQTAPVLEGPISQIAPVLESISNGSASQPAPVLESHSNGPSIQTAVPVPESIPNVSFSQAAPVVQNSNGSSNQTAPIPESISNNGASAQTAPAPNPQPEAQPPVARPKKKPVRPVEIKFGSVKRHIRYATEIPVAIANWLIEQGKELPITANFIHPSDAGFSQSATTKKLKSGQFMRVGHNQEALLHKARELLDGCGYEGVQIKVLMDNGITLSA